MVKYAGNGKLSRTNLNTIFGKKTGRPDEECWELDRFVCNTMSGCGWDVRGWEDVLEFMNEFGLFRQSRWNMWKDGANPDEGMWAVVEKKDGTPRWAWFQKGMRISEWAPLSEDSPVTKKLVPFKNGYFKSVPV